VFLHARRGLSGGSGDEGGDDVGGVAVEADAGAVVARRARVGVAGGFLDIAQWDARVKGGGDEGVAKRVRADPFVEAGVAAMRCTIRDAAWRSSRWPSSPSVLKVQARTCRYIRRSCTRGWRGASSLLLGGSSMSMFKQARAKTLGLLLIGTLVMAVSGIGVAVASIPDSGGVIHACYKKSTHGEMHLVNSASDCNPSEKAIQWNQTGPAGPPGPPGPPGTPGSSFLAGSSGTQLSNGNNGGGCGGFIGVGNCAFSQDLVEQVVPISGTLHNLYVHLSAAPGAGVDEKWQINVNNAGTSLACHISGSATSCSDTTVNFPFNAGDTITLEASETTIGGATPAVVTWAVQAG
jgi:hypothetical protein